MKNNGRGWLLSFIIATLITGILSITIHNRWLILPMVILGIFTIVGIFFVPNNPKNIAVLTKWEVRIPITFKEGLAFLPFRGIMFGYILVDVTKKNIDFPEQVLTTPDNATTKVKTSLSYYPDPENIITFLDINGEHGLMEMITDIEDEKLRIWSRSTNFGPQTWEALNDSSDEAVKIIIAEICGINIGDLNPEDVRKIQKGSGKWKIPHLGIILVRYNIGVMENFGSVYEASVALKKEERERKSEIYEVSTDLNKAKALKDKLASSGINITLDEAMTKIMDWKIQREANQQLSISSIAKSIIGAMKGGVE